MEYGSLIVDEIGSKLICFGLDKVALFMKLQTGVVIQLKFKVGSLVMQCIVCTSNLPSNVNSFCIAPSW